MNTMNYKGYTGKFEYDSDADLFHGEVLNLRDVITFQGRSIDAVAYTNLTLPTNRDGWIAVSADSYRKKNTTDSTDY